MQRMTNGLNALLPTVARRLYNLYTSSRLPRQNARILVVDYPKVFPDDDQPAVTMRAFQSRGPLWAMIS